MQTQRNPICKRSENDYGEQQESCARGKGCPEQIQDGGCERGGREPEAGLQRRPYLEAGRFRRRSDGEKDDQGL